MGPDAEPALALPAVVGPAAQGTVAPPLVLAEGGLGPPPWPNTRLYREPSGLGTNRRAIWPRYLPPGGAYLTASGTECYPGG